MADVGENLRTTIISSTAIKAVLTNYATIGAVEQDTYRESPPLPRIWFSRSIQNSELDLSGTAGLEQSIWDIEVQDDEINTAQNIAAVTKKYLHGRRGMFGTGTVLGIFISDHDDQYIPRSVSSEDGIYVAAMSAEIWFAST